MNIQTIYSTHTDLSKAVGEIKEGLSGFQATLVLFFASSHYNPQAVSSLMQSAFPGAVVAGCSTAGELISGRMLDQSIVAMAFTGEAMADVQLSVATNLHGDELAVQKAFARLEDGLGTTMQTLDPEKYVGILLTDGMSGLEEKVNDQIGNLTNITFIGGSAGDDLRFERTFVYAHGEAFSDAALLLVLKPKAKFSFLKTQSFLPTDKVLTVTKLDEARREIAEFNDQPATVAYARALGIEEQHLADHLFKNPLGLMFDPQTPFVRSPMKIEEQKVVFYCGMKKGMNLTLLSSTDIVKDTHIALEQAREAMNGVSAIVNFNCILRTLDLKQQNKTQAYADLFKDVPTVGFSTYGENYIGFINQTATMLLLKE
jgi:hypothetical protein